MASIRVTQAYYAAEEAEPLPLERTLVAPFYGVFNADTQAAKTAWSGAGGTHVVIAARWSDLEPTKGTIDATALTALKAQFAQAATAGLDVIFSFSFHYTPSWIKTGGTAAPRCKAQNGTEYTGANVDGNDVVDFVFSDVARLAVTSFQERVWAALTTGERAQVKGWRVGGGAYGELHYPQAVGDARWWGYSTPAQTGVGLAVGMDPCPVPGHVPFTAYTTGGVLSSQAFSMEPSIASWEAAATGIALTAETGIVDQGTQSLRIAQTSGTNRAQARLVAGERVAVSVGQTVNVRARMRNATSGRNGAVGIEWWDGPVLLSTSWSTTTAISSSEWRPITVSDIAPSGATHFGVIAGLASDAASSSQPFLLDSVNAYLGANPDVRFTDWYLEALSRYMVWQVERVRSLGYTGSVHVLHPSFGLRDNFAFGGADYITQAAEGVDWVRQVSAYPDDETWPQGTWANQEDPWDPEADQVFVVDSDKASWRKLLEVAQAFGRAELIAGENTGGSDPDWDNNADIDRMFSTVGAYADGRYQGLTWLNYPRLNGEVAGTHATLARLSTEMSAPVVEARVRVFLATYEASPYEVPPADVNPPSATATASAVAPTFGIPATVRIYRATYEAQEYVSAALLLTPPAAEATAAGPDVELARWAQVFPEPGTSSSEAGAVSTPTATGAPPALATATATVPEVTGRGSVSLAAASATADAVGAVAVGGLGIIVPPATATASAPRPAVRGTNVQVIPDDALLTTIPARKALLTTIPDAGRLTTIPARRGRLTTIPARRAQLTTEENAWQTTSL